MVNEWPEGHRHVHHGQEAQRSRDEQARVFRDHHTEDQHTIDGEYAAIDEAFTRLDALERPTTTARLNRLRKIAEARVIRRRYNMEANWLVENDEHLHYQHHHRLHTKYPDQYTHPAKEGLELRDEDKARIGPTREDIDIECDARIDDLRPRLSELLAYRALNKTLFPGNSDHITLLLTGRVETIERERQRARFLKVLNLVADDYFEPYHWFDSKSRKLRRHVRTSQLGTIDESWHTLAAGAMQAESEHEDLLAICSAVLEASKHTTWMDPPNDLPTYSVIRTPSTITIALDSAVPQGVTMQAIMVTTGDMTTSSPLDNTVTRNPHSFNLAGGRVAVLVQFAKNNQRTMGAIDYVGALN